MTLFPKRDLESAVVASGEELQPDKALAAALGCADKNRDRVLGLDPDLKEDKCLSIGAFPN
jgi:hypothetical protein